MKFKVTGAWSSILSLSKDVGARARRMVRPRLLIAAHDADALRPSLVPLALIAIFACPLVWMFSYSFRPTNLPPPTHLELFAPPLAFENYARVTQIFPLAQYTWNSIKVVLLAVPLTVITASWAGFALAQIEWRARTALVTLSVALLLVPAPALWVPRFLIFSQLEWIDTLWSMIAPAFMGTNPFYVLMFYIAFARIPGDLYDSARLDGARPLGIWATVAMPIARPTTIAVTLLSFAFYWSDYASPLMYLRSESNFTLPVAVQLLQQAIRANWPLLMAASVILAAPVVLLFIVTQRWFLQEYFTRARWSR